MLFGKLYQDFIYYASNGTNVIIKLILQIKQKVVTLLKLPIKNILIQNVLACAIFIKFFNFNNS